MTFTNTATLVGLSLGLIAAPVHAACTGGFLNGSAVISALSGKTVCSPSGCSSSSGNCSWSEYHAAASGLFDYKRGPGHPVDPTDTTSIGTWSVSTTGPTQGKITYTYSGGHTGIYDVHDDGGGNYSFCNGPSSPIGAKVIAGQVPCN